MSASKALASTRLGYAALLLDLACICLFVLLGRESHGLDEGPGWFLMVAWPFAAGWLVAAFALRLYSVRPGGLRRLAATVVVGVAIALVVRVLATQRSTPAAFIVVAYAFIGLTTVGWRIVPPAVARLTHRLT